MTQPTASVAGHQCGTQAGVLNSLYHFCLPASLLTDLYFVDDNPEQRGKTSLSDRHHIYRLYLHVLIHYFVPEKFSVAYKVLFSDIKRNKIN